MNSIPTIDNPSSQADADIALKARHRAMWASGDYPLMVDTFLQPLGPRLVEACAVGAGDRVLDVATGTGNAAVPAARIGASVTASDLTPELLGAGSRRADAVGLDLTWTTADAEHLPFAVKSFDVVMSAIGVMFAPHHQVAADELVRVCRPGGTLGLLNWTPEGMIGSLLAAMRPFASASASRSLAPAVVGHRGPRARSLRRPSGLAQHDERDTAGGLLRSSLRLRRAHQGLLRTHDHQSGECLAERHPRRVRCGAR